MFSVGARLETLHIGKLLAIQVELTLVVYYLFFVHVHDPIVNNSISSIYAFILYDGDVVQSINLVSNHVYLITIQLLLIED